eukprot:2793259-Alexandrium_andersonii.AAC.1
MTTVRRQQQWCELCVLAGCNERRLDENETTNSRKQHIPFLLLTSVPPRPNAWVEIELKLQAKANQPFPGCNMYGSSTNRPPHSEHSKCPCQRGT